MTLLHKVEFKKVDDIKHYLNSNKHWVYCTDNNTKWDSANTLQEKIYERISKNDQGYLEFHRFADEPDDKNGDYYLRPRIEIVPVFARVPKRTLVHVQYVVSLVEGGNDFRGLIFQIMDHQNKGGTLPIFQFEMRDGNLYARHTDVGPDSTNDGTHIYKIARPKWGEDEWHVLDVYMYLSHLDDGYIRVYRNGQFAWDRKGRNASESGGNPQIQYGIYGIKGFSLKTQVKSLLWETIDEFPSTLTLPEPSILPLDEIQSVMFDETLSWGVSRYRVLVTKLE